MSNDHYKYVQDARWMDGKSNEEVNRICCERINDYWAKRGVEANARVEDRHHKLLNGSITKLRVIVSDLKFGTKQDATKDFGDEPPR